MAIAQPLYATESICFDKDTAGRILIDLKVCKSDKELLYEAIDQYKIKTDGLSKDKEEYKKQANQFKELYVKAEEENKNLKNSTPSRFTWFSIGGITAAVLFIAGMFAIK